MQSKNLMMSVAGLVVALFSLSAGATTAGCYTHGSGGANYVGGCDGKSYYSFEKLDADATLDKGDSLSLKVASLTIGGKAGVLFKVENKNSDWYTNGNRYYHDTSITNVYFDVGSFLVPNNNDIYNNGIKIYDQSSGVNYWEYYTSNSGFEMKNAAGTQVPAWQFDADYSFYSSGTTNSHNASYGNGVNSTAEYVTFWGLLSNGKSFQNVLDGLSDGSFKVGIKLSTLVTDKWCNNQQTVIKTNYLIDKCVTPVPLPAAAWLFGSALIGFVTVSNRRKV